MSLGFDTGFEMAAGALGFPGFIWQLILLKIQLNFPIKSYISLKVWEIAYISILICSLIDKL